MPPSKSRCVKLYLCSNPADSVVERRALRENVFPKLGRLCRDTLGLDFRVIDPYESVDPHHWPDENTRRQLIKECRENSAGPFFLALVGHQYGSSALPIQVEVSEFQLLLQEGQQAGINTAALERHYQRDENAIPPSYLLRAAHTHTQDPQAELLQEDHEALMMTLRSAVSLCVHSGVLTPEKAHRYHRSALDADLRCALENCRRKDVARRCLVYVHHVVNAKGEMEKRPAAGDQAKAASCDEVPERATPTEKELLSELCDSFLRGLITSCRLLVYTTTTECDRRHGYTTARRRGYTESLVWQVCSDLVELMDGLEKSRDSKLSDALAQEHTEQEELLDVLAGFYDVPRPEEEEIRSHLVQSNRQHPLVVTGGPCAGKTVLLAHCAQQMTSWLQHSDPVVITYFANLSNRPSLNYLLSNLCYQITSSYCSLTQDANANITNGGSTCTSNPTDNNSGRLLPDSCNVDLTALSQNLGGVVAPDTDPSVLAKCVSSLLSSQPSAERPLVLILDGVDQMENNAAVQLIDSLPSPLPPAVKFILTVSSKNTAVTRAVGLRYPESTAVPCASEGCVSLGMADRKQCVRLLTSLLSRSGRRVTSGQQVLVNQALTSCGVTLYARLLRTHTSLWHSDSDVSESSLPDSVRSSISALLEHLEQKHDSRLVAHAVSYLSLSRTGLTEAELADLLSRHGDVLADQGLLPCSDRRVSQVDVERLLLDLSGFLIRRPVAGSRVLSWMCRYFGLVAAKRYFGTREARRAFHSAMADYFSGGWLNAEMPDNQKNKDTEQTDKLLLGLSSPDKEHASLTKVGDLVYHLRESNRWELSLLMSLRFHQAMARAGLVRDLVAMLRREEGSPPYARERAFLASILRSADCFLCCSPLELPTAIETHLVPYLEVFPALEGYADEIRRERRRRGCGVGVAVPPAPSMVAPILLGEPRTRGASEAAGAECGVVAMVADDGSAWIRKAPGCDFAELSLGGEQRGVTFAGVKSSGRFVLLHTRCGKLLLWDVKGPETFLEVRDPLKAGSANVDGFVACREKLCVWRKGESAALVFGSSGDAVTRFQCQSRVTCVVWSANGSYMYCGQEEGTVSIFDTDNRGLLGTCSNSNHSVVKTIILCDNKQEMACVDWMGDASVWDLTDMSPRLVKESIAGGKSNILNTDYSVEVSTLLVCQCDQVTLWDTCDWEVCDHFLAPRGRAFTQAVLSQDGHLFLALLEGCTQVPVWRVDTGVCVLSLDATQQPLELLKSSSDVVCVTRDGCLLAWDSAMICAAGAAPKMTHGVKEVVVERSEQWFYTADGSDAVWRWSLETGLPNETFLHDNGVEKVRVSPDDLHLVTLSAGDIYIWRTETGENIVRIRGGRAADVLITPNGNFGVSISHRGLSRVWKLANGGIVCNIHTHLSNPQVSPESTFLIGCRRGDLLAASLWSGTISKRFSCVESSEHVVAFQTLTEHAEFVIVLVASGAVYTWKISEETVCRHFQLLETFDCCPQDFHMTSDGSFALLSTDNDVISLLDMSQIRLCSLKAEGSVIRACLDSTGCYAAYIWRPASLERRCACYQHSRPVLTVLRLSDGERVGSVLLPEQPLTLVMCGLQAVFVGFEDGSVGVYSISDIVFSREEMFRCRQTLNGHIKECPFDKVPFSFAPLAIPNITWP